MSIRPLLECFVNATRFPSWLALNYNLSVSLIEPLRYHRRVRRVIRNRDNNQITLTTVSDNYNQIRPFKHSLKRSLLEDF